MTDEDTQADAQTGAQANQDEFNQDDLIEELNTVQDNLSTIQDEVRALRQELAALRSEFSAVMTPLPQKDMDIHATVMASQNRLRQQADELRSKL